MKIKMKYEKREGKWISQEEDFDSIEGLMSRVLILSAFPEVKRYRDIRITIEHTDFNEDFMLFYA